MVRIYHNPRCSKSRAALELVRDRGIEPEIIEYLSAPPDAATLVEILRLLGIEARALLRPGESEYRELGLDSPSLTERQIVQAICAHPRLMQRPIVVSEKGARIGRPPESVLDVL
jgi:arsenate reductase